MGSSFEMHPVERTIYHPILKYLEDLGFVGIQEIKKGTDYVDILFMSGRSTFILEVKVERKGDSDSIISGIVQAYRYGLDYGTKNLIVISYPSSVRESIQSFDEVRERALKSRVEAVILTENWYSYETKFNVEDIFSNLKAKIDRKLIAVMNVESASAVIQKGVKAFSRLINKYYKDERSLIEVANHLTKDYGLFLKLSSSKISKARMRNQTIDLLAYILVNQILFYFLYSKKSQEMDASRRVPEIKPIGHISELSRYFDQLREIDYRPIFDILVVPRIPSNPEMVNEINRLIECLIPLQISEMRHDIYGRLIGNSLPRETRKILASYYTKTSSADLLANLTIDKPFETVWDLACGSGTLLVSSYDRKMKLYQREKRTLDELDKDKLHIRFVEREITGTDIMPFACHLTGLNLSAKNLKSFTNFLRISVINSLRIESLEKPITIEEAYGDISKELEKVHLAQQILDTFVETRKLIKRKPRRFQLEKVDCVVVNPPFTSINKLPDGYRRSFTSSSLSRICGKRIHLWGHFLALTDQVLKDGGKVGAIIPISLLHGKDTLKLRKYYLENYSIEYIIKPIVGKPFSEDSNFTDMIFIARKVKPDRNHRIRFVCLKEDINDFSTVDVETLAKNIKMELEDEVDNTEYLSYLVDQQELLQNSENLMRYIFTNDGELQANVKNIMDEMRANSKFIRIDEKDIRDGHQLRPRGEVAHSVITRHYSDSRVIRAILSFKSADDTSSDTLGYYDKEKQQMATIQKSKLSKTLRTLTGIDVLDITNLYDYILRTKVRIKEKVHLVIQNRFWFKSNELFLTSAYTDEPVCPMNLFMMYRCSKNDAKILSVYFNSIFYLIQLLALAKQSTRGYLEIKQFDLNQVLIPNINKMNKNNRAKLEDFFEKNRRRKLESIPEQLSNKTDYRLTLDRTVADALGIKIARRNLLRLYDLVWKHISSLP